MYIVKKFTLVFHKQIMASHNTQAMTIGSIAGSSNNWYLDLGCPPLIYSIFTLSLANVGFGFFLIHPLTPALFGLGA